MSVKLEKDSNIKKRRLTFFRKTFKKVELD